MQRRIGREHFEIGNRDFRDLRFEAQRREHEVRVGRGEAQAARGMADDAFAGYLAGRDVDRADFALIVAVSDVERLFVGAEAHVVRSSRKRDCALNFRFRDVDYGDVFRIHIERVERRAVLGRNELNRAFVVAGGRGGARERNRKRGGE